MQELISKNASKSDLLSKQEEIQKTNEKLINSVLNKSISNSGPVHLNVPLEEPLYGTTNIEIVPKNISTFDSPKIIKPSDVIS